MNDAHLHIILVHIPIVLVPAGAVMLLVSLARRSQAASTAALSLLAVATIFAVPAFLLGEGAEELVEHLPGISESLIENHEEAADVALWLTVATGIASGASLLGLLLRQNWARHSRLVALLLAIVASASLSYAGSEGGKIRHPEAYATSEAGSQDNDDD